MKRYDVLLLDIDGTLLDFDKGELCAFKRVLEAYTIPYSEETYACYKKINKALWKALELGEVTKTELKVARFQKFLEAMAVKADAVQMSHAYEKELGEEAHFLEGAKELCYKLKGQFVLAAATNGITHIQQNRLKKSGLGEVFEHIFISEQIGANKPEVAFYEAVFKVLGEVDKSRVLMVGDSLSADIKGGINAGIDTCWYNPGGIEKDPNIIPTYEIKKIGDLEKLIGA